MEMFSANPFYNGGLNYAQTTTCTTTPVDFNKPIECNLFGPNNWVPASVIEKNWKGSNGNNVLIKFTSMGIDSSVPCNAYSSFVRNKIEKKVYTVAVLAKSGKRLVVFTKEHDEYIIVGTDGARFGHNGYKVVGVHKGEYTV